MAPLNNNAFIELQVEVNFLLMFMDHLQPENGHSHL